MIREKLERAILAAVITSETLGHDWFESLDLATADIVGPQHRAILKACWDCKKAGREVNYLNLSEHLDATTGDLAERLFDSSMMSTQNELRIHVEQLHEMNKARRFDMVLREAVTRLEGGTSPGEVRSWMAEQDTIDTSRVKGVTHIKDVLGLAFEQIELAKKAGYYLPIGLEGMQDYAPEPAEYVIIGAEPSVGKTALGLSMMLGMAYGNAGCLLVSAEMAKAQIGNRLLGQDSMVNMASFMRSGGNGHEWERITDSAGRLAKLPIWVTTATDLVTITNLARNMRRTQGIRAIIIDYLQMLNLGRADNRERQVAEASRSLKNLARQTDLTVFCLSQLSRSKSDDPPTMSRLRDSGMLEADADKIFLLHRPNHGEDTDTTLSVCIAKNRNGKAGATVELRFDAGSVRGAP